MKKPLFTGVCTALVTPFRDGKINFEMIERLLQFQIDNGVSAIVLAGTTGEAPTLSDEEKIELFAFSKAYTGNQCTIIAGTGTNNTEHSVRLSQAAEEAGVDGLLLVTPYYNKTNADGLCAHYQTIAESVSLPVILYNVPSRTGVDIPVNVYKRLSAIPNINGVKEATTDIVKQLRTQAICGNDLYIWTGNDDLVVPSVAIGGLGVISVLSNPCPAETVEMVDAALSGNLAKATSMQKDFLPIIDLLFSDINPIPVKYMMGTIGFDCGECRLPLYKPTDELKNKIKQLLK